jgi:hypothetical protein
MSHPAESSELHVTNRSASRGLRRLAPVEHRPGRLSVTPDHHVRELPVTPAEVAQARLFEDILQAEVAELEQLAHRLAGSLNRRPDLDSHEVARDLRLLRERNEEVHRLVRALHGRFPRSQWDGAPDA